jgi:hypothetical protein
MLEQPGVRRIEAGIQDTAASIDRGSDHVCERTKPVAKPTVPSGGLTILREACSGLGVKA